MGLRFCDGASRTCLRDPAQPECYKTVGHSAPERILEALVGLWSERVGFLRSSCRMEVAKEFLPALGVRLQAMRSKLPCVAVREGDSAQPWGRMSVLSL